MLLQKSGPGRKDANRSLTTVRPTLAGVLRHCGDVYGRVILERAQTCLRAKVIDDTLVNGYFRTILVHFHATNRVR